MAKKWHQMGLILLLLILLSSCDDNTSSQLTTASFSPSKDAIILSKDQVGAINSTTPFNIHHLTKIFKQFNVSQQTSFQEGEAYPIIHIAKGAKDLMTLNPTADQKHIYSVVIEDNFIHNQLGHPLNTKFSEIYTDGGIEKCLAGKEELSGKTLCYAPKARNILYIFSGRWNGPDDKVPPESVLSTWSLDSIIWKPYR
ncbi:MAG: DUF1131 family protein [Cocleimonas sp.]|nr:DUF1131 family protein [Cocleimonas sp.]